MTSEELYDAYLAEEELEYHLTGAETGANLLPGPGWYPVLVVYIYANRNVEISFTGEELDGIGVTVLEKNFSIAFRKKQEQVVQA